ncbi:hypothetical protein, partial [Pseudoalteromonas sp. SIMBA_162]|uniref:hypothetical protein n=1 Tax=Pseudoalteromonas sp. SIMBA_162 TaxID=3080867 RepID=UPI003979B723
VLAACNTAEEPKAEPTKDSVTADSDINNNVDETEPPITNEQEEDSQATSEQEEDSQATSEQESQILYTSNNEEHKEATTS